jgi:hypothetical protein
MLMSAVLACQTSPQPPAAVPVQAVTPSAAAPTAESTAFPTVTPLATSTLIPTPGESPTVTVTATVGARGGAPTATATLSGPAAKLQFTVDDMTYWLSPKRKSDSKAQMTIELHPQGGLPPYSFVLDPGPGEIQGSGLTFTFDWHNCGQSEPHTIILISADGQRSKPVGFIFPYDCE